MTGHYKIALLGALTQCHGLLLLVNHTVDVKFEEGKVLVSFTDFS